MIDRLTCAAPAKVNLDLKVVGRRADGYHLLDSLVVFADLADTLIIDPAPTLSLSIEGPTANDLDGDDNLVMRAALALRDAVGVAAGAQMRLIKRIPVAAGLGGGSADAAAALAGLSRLWRLDLSPAQLAAIGGRLGADIPACLAGTPLLMRGIGDSIEPLPRLDTTMGLLLANPGIALPTREVFAALAPLHRNALTVDRSGFSAGDRDGFLAMLAANGNDLEAAALRIAPKIATILAALRALPGCRHVAMSGSGATCAALFDNAAAAAAAAGLLQAAGPGLWTHAGAIVL